HEAKAADVIFVGRNEVAALLGGGSIAAERGDAFGHAGVLIAPDRRNHDPVGCVITFKGATILLVRFTGLEALSLDRFPGVRVPIADGPIRAAPLIVREQLRKGLRHGRPGAIFLIPAAARAKAGMDLRVMLSIEMEAAMACRRITDDSRSEERRVGKECKSQREEDAKKKEKRETEAEHA